MNIKNVILVSVCAFLTLSSCKDNRERLVLGKVHAQYVVKGKIVDGSNHALSNVKVVTAIDSSIPDTIVNLPYYAWSDTTSNDGKFECRLEGKFSKLYVTVSDTNGKYQNKNIEIQLDSADYKDGSGWYLGKVEKDLTINLAETKTDKI